MEIVRCSRLDDLGLKQATAPETVPSLSLSHLMPSLSGDERLDRIVEALQQINIQLEGLRVTIVANSEAVSDHEKRLRMIEQWRHSLTPLFAVGTFILGAVASTAVRHFFW